MDNGPFRMGNAASGGRNTGRSAASGRAGAERVPRAEPSEPTQAHEPVRHHAPSPPPQSTSKGKGWLKPVLITAGALMVLIIGIAGWLLTRGGVSEAIDQGKYQAVFFTNGQVYFGKLHSFNDQYMKLTDVYYLQTQNGEAGDSKNPQKTAGDDNNVQLIKLGNEIHGPEDEMIIARDQMLFYENLRSDGKVAQSIQKHKNTQ